MHTVPRLSRHQRSASACTMFSPRPEVDSGSTSTSVGFVAPPASLTEICTQASATRHAAWKRPPGSGVACRIALANNSESTNAASCCRSAGTVPAAARAESKSTRAEATAAGSQATWIAALLTASRPASDWPSVSHHVTAIVCHPHHDPLSPVPNLVGQSRLPRHPPSSRTQE